MAVFVHPDHETDIRPFELIKEGAALQYDDFESNKKTAKDHINQRFAETYVN